MPSSIPCCKTRSAAFPRCLRQQKPKILAIYEDDFNFLSKMCLTRMRELAWQLAHAAQACGSHRDRSRLRRHRSRQRLSATTASTLFCVGEAEQSLVELCAVDSRRRRAPTGHPRRASTSMPQGNLVQSPVKSPRNANWKNLPKPARELIDLEPYRQAWISAHGHFSTNVVASRGCPYRCNWCAKPISGNKFQLRPAELVAAEIRELKEVYGVQHIWFGDDIFALNQHWVQQFADEIEALDCALPFKIQSRADLMTQETVASLKRAGCAEVWMGVESGSQKSARRDGQGLACREVEAARARLGDAGIRACYFLQFGYPGRAWEDIQQTIALVRNTRPDDIGVSFSYPLPGTVFFERVQEQIGAKTKLDRQR